MFEKLFDFLIPIFGGIFCIIYGITKCIKHEKSKRNIVIIISGVLMLMFTFLLITNK